VLFVVTEDWYFVSHRLPLARAARDAGYRVVIASRFAEHEALLRHEGFELVPLLLRRRAAGLANEFASIRELRQLYRRLRPAVVHHVALKPVVFGTIASWGLDGLGIVNALAGLGYAFTSRGIRALSRRIALSAALAVLLRRRASVTIVQNEEDRDSLKGAIRLGRDRVRLIRGAGVDLTEFLLTPEADGPPVVLYAGRFLWTKGVGDFVGAAKSLRADGVRARFVLVGAPDDDNPESVSREQVDAWVSEGAVEHWGRRTDMPAVLAAAHVVCLPSRYGEGVPKILLEAAAGGRAIVTTDWPGCRDAVVDGETGLLVAAGDVSALAAAIRYLVNDRTRRRQFGEAARSLAEREFDVKRVVEGTLACYREVAPR